MPDRTAGRLIAENPLTKANFHRLYHEIARMTTLTQGAKVAHAMLISYATMYDEVYPGMVTMAEDCGTSRHSIMRHMKELEEAGLLRVERPKGGRTNIYILLDWTRKQSRRLQRSDLQRSSVERSTMRLSSPRVELSKSQSGTHKRKQGATKNSPRKESRDQFMDRRADELGWSRYLNGDQTRQLEREWYEQGGGE